MTQAPAIDDLRLNPEALEVRRAINRGRAERGLGPLPETSVYEQDERRIRENADPSTEAELDRVWAENQDRCGWEPTDIAAALKKTGPSPPSLLLRSDGVPLLYPGRSNAFIGESESGKSFGWQVAAAQELRNPAGGVVAVTDFENDVYAVIERLRALGVTDDEMLDRLIYLSPDGPWSDQAAYQLATIRQKALALVVIDGVTDGMAALGLDPDKNKDAATFDRMLIKPFARTGAAVVLIDHVVKDREGRGRFAIGAQHKLAAIDGAAFIFDVVQPFGREREGLIRISLTKDKPGWLRRQAAGKTIAMLRLKSWPDGGITGGFEPATTTGVDGGFMPTALMEKASRYIETHPGLSKRSVVEAMGGKRDYALLAVEHLVTKDFVRVEPGPRGAQLHHSHRPYREDDGSTTETTNDPEL